jgi:hypothetical protein
VRINDTRIEGYNDIQGITIKDATNLTIQNVQLYRVDVTVQSLNEVTLKSIIDNLNLSSVNFSFQVNVLGSVEFSSMVQQQGLIDLKLSQLQLVTIENSAFDRLLGFRLNISSVSSASLSRLNISGDFKTEDFISIDNVKKLTFNDRIRTAFTDIELINISSIEAYKERAAYLVVDRSTTLFKSITFNYLQIELESTLSLDVEDAKFNGTTLLLYGNESCPNVDYTFEHCSFFNRSEFNIEQFCGSLQLANFNVLRSVGDQIGIYVKDTTAKFNEVLFDLPYLNQLSSNQTTFITGSSSTAEFTKVEIYTYNHTIIDLQGPMGNLTFKNCTILVLGKSFAKIIINGWAQTSLLLIDSSHFENVEIETNGIHEQKLINTSLLRSDITLLSFRILAIEEFICSGAFKLYSAEPDSSVQLLNITLSDRASVTWDIRDSLKI